MNKVTVFDFVTEFNNFYNNVLALIDEAYSNGTVNRICVDNVYDTLINYKNEIERTLEARVLSVEKASNMLNDKCETFVKIANNYVDNYNLLGDMESYNSYVFLNSIIDCYNELVETLFEQ